VVVQDATSPFTFSLHGVNEGEPPRAPQSDRPG